MQKNDVIEFILAGFAGCGAGIFTNPLEVIKTRMQLQGELKARGQHAVFYKNSLHAAYAIAKSDGIFALQSGLVPGLWYQFVMNGFRLGSYQIFVNLGFTDDKDGNYSFTRRVLAGAIAGVIGTAIGSPLYLVYHFYIYFFVIHVCPNCTCMPVYYKYTFISDIFLFYEPMVKNRYQSVIMPGI